MKVRIKRTVIQETVHDISDWDDDMSRSDIRKKEENMDQDSFKGEFIEIWENGFADRLDTATTVTFEDA